MSLSSPHPPLHPFSPPPGRFKDFLLCSDQYYSTDCYVPFSCVCPLPGFEHRNSDSKPYSPNFVAWTLANATFVLHPPVPFRVFQPLRCSTLLLLGCYACYWHCQNASPPLFATKPYLTFRSQMKCHPAVVPGAANAALCGTCVVGLCGLTSLLELSVS